MFVRFVAVPRLRPVMKAINMTNRFLRSVRGLVTASSKGNQSRITIKHTLAHTHAHSHGFALVFGHFRIMTIKCDCVSPCRFASFGRDFSSCCCCYCPHGTPAPCLSSVICSYLDKTTSSSPELPNDALATTATLAIYRRRCCCCC